MKIRAEYEAGGISLSTLAKKYKLDPSTVKRHSSKESWVKGATESATEAQPIIRDHVVQQIVKKAISRLDMYNTFRNKVYDHIADPERPLNFKTSGEAIKTFMEVDQALADMEGATTEKVTGIEYYELVHTGGEIETESPSALPPG